MALHALFECLGILFNKLDLKDPIALNWVRFRPGIWDSGATSSTDSWACERRFTHWCLGFMPKRALITDQSTSTGGVNIKLHSSSGDHKSVKSISV